MRQPLKFIIANCLLSSVVFAQTPITELEPMIVTATVSYEPSFNQQAISKNELDGQELIERGINGIEDISQRIANFHFTNVGSGSFGQYFSLRGLTNTALFSAPSVVFYVDDVPYSSSMTTMGDLFNIDSLEVYRSSQPGRFGKNAYAGAIDIKTKQAENKLSSSVALGLGSFNLHQVSANSSGALITNQLYFTISGQYLQRDGFLYNNYLNTQPDEQEHFSGRASLKWTPSKEWDMRLTLTKEDFDYGATRFARLDSPSFFTVQSETDEKLEQQSDSQALRIAYNSDNYALLSISSRRFWQMNPRLVDLDLLAPPSPLFIRTQNLTEQAWTQEFRLRPKNKQSHWDWQAGLFYSNADKSGASNTLFSGTNARIELKNREIDNYALFGQLAYLGFKQIKPYIDLRMDYVDTNVNAASSYPTAATAILQQSKDNIFVSPKFGIDYTLSPNLLFYTATGLSYKPAGFTVADINSNLSHYDRETVWHNELGMKSNWFDNRFKLNLAGFYYDIDNYQVERFFTQLDYGMVNANKAHSYGFELESHAELVKNLWLETALGYTHTQFDRYNDPITGVNYAGKLAPFIPDFTSTIALQYKNARGYFARAEWLWTGKTYFDENNTDIMAQNAYSTANLRIGYEQKKYSIYVFASNITDTHYYSFKLGNTRGTPGDPRMIGVRLAMNF